jgi:hypothetical protein
MYVAEEQGRVSRMFFIKRGSSIHEAVKKASRIIEWFGNEVREARNT